MYSKEDGRYKLSVFWSRISNDNRGRYFFT